MGGFSTSVCLLQRGMGSGQIDRIFAELMQGVPGAETALRQFGE